MKLEILSEAPVSCKEVKQLLEKVKERDTTLNFRAQKTLDYLQQVSTLGPKKHKELCDALAALKIPRLKEQHTIKLCDVLPATPDDVKVTLQGYNITISKDNLKKIAESIKSAL